MWLTAAANGWRLMAAAFGSTVFKQAFKIWAQIVAKIAFAWDLMGSQQAGLK